MFDGHRLAREIDQPDPEVALPYLRERPLDDSPPPPPLPVPMPPREEAMPRRRTVELVDGGVDAIAERIDQIAAGAGSVIVAAGRGAGPDLEPYRRLAERYGGAFAVSRPQVEAGRTTRADLVGASSRTVSPDVYLAFGISGALPHLLGMAGSGTVVAVNTDRGARIFDHADVGAVADAVNVVQRMCERHPIG